MTNIFIWVSIYYRFQPGNIIKNKEINSMQKITFDSVIIAPIVLLAESNKQLTLRMGSN
jgi:hypothetical protein